MRKVPSLTLILLAAVSALAVSGCNGMRRLGNAAVPGQPFGKVEKIVCRQSNKDYVGAKEMPSLKAPAGLEAPDTRNSLKVPALNTPERVRGRHRCVGQRQGVAVTGQPHHIAAGDARLELPSRGEAQHGRPVGEAAAPDQCLDHVHPGSVHRITRRVRHDPQAAVDSSLARPSSR